MEQKDRGSLDERSRSGFSDRRRSCSRFVSLEGGHRIVGPLEIVDLHDPLGLVHDEISCPSSGARRSATVSRSSTGPTVSEMRIDPIEKPDDPKDP